LVADHLAGNGFRHFAVFDLDTETYFEERRDGFRSHVEARGHICHVFHGGTAGEHPSDWERHQDRVADWVAALPKPVGILACTDQLGFWLLDACRRAGIAVPEEVAVVGVENDETLCQLATPRLSSVAFDGVRVGYEAAALLVETDLTLAEIADRCGMEHPQYLAASFKKQFGMTPGAFRRKHGVA
jgi:LacI family transcriptional regulator